MLADLRTRLFGHLPKTEVAGRPLAGVDFLFLFEQHREGGRTTPSVRQPALEPIEEVARQLCCGATRNDRHVRRGGRGARLFSPSPMGQHLEFPGTTLDSKFRRPGNSQPLHQFAGAHAGDELLVRSNQ